MWAITKEESFIYAIKNNSRMRFARSKSECPPLERLDAPSCEELKSAHVSGDPQKAVIMTFQGGKRQFASRGNFDWSYNDLSRGFKDITDVPAFVEAVNFVIGTSIEFVQETQMDSEETQYADDSGFLEPVCPETCPTVGTQEVNEPPIKRSRVKPLQASLSRKKMTSVQDDQENLIRRIREKTLPGVHQIMLSRIEGPVTPFRDTNASFVKQIKNGQTAACTSPQPLAVHLIGESDLSKVDLQHLNGYSYKCLGGNHQRLAAVENHALYPNMPQFLSMASHIFINLSAEEEIFVATNHNIIGHHIHKISHKDMVKLFRSVKPNLIDVASKRCEDTREWREKCQHHLPPGTELSSYQSIFWIACSREDVYRQCLLVFDLYEQGKLKNQKLKKQESIITPSLNVTRPWRALMTLPEETVMELLLKVTNLEHDLEEMTKEAEYLKGTRNIQIAVCKISKMPWDKTMTTFWTNEDEAEEELSQFIGDVKRGVPGERLRQFMEGKVKDPSITAKPVVFQEDPLTFLRDGRLETSVDVIIFNEEVSDWQPLLRVCIDLPSLKEDHIVVLTSSWSGVSDTKKALELMYPNKGSTVVVHYNKKCNCIQPFVCLLAHKSELKKMSPMVEGNSKMAFFEKLFLNLNKKGNLLVLHCGKGEALKAGMRRNFNITGVDERNEMVRACNRQLY